MWEHKGMLTGTTQLLGEMEYLLLSIIANHHYLIDLHKLDTLKPRAYVWSSAHCTLTTPLQQKLKISRCRDNSGQFIVTTRLLVVDWCQRC